MSISPQIILGTPPPASVARDSIPSSFNWATVVDDSPLTIRLDGQADNLGIVPDSPNGIPAVGSRVWVQQWGKRVIILSGGGAGTGGHGEEFLATSKSSPNTFSSTSDIVWNAAATNEGTLWVRDGTNVYWVCQEDGVYAMKMLYATTGLTAGNSTRCIFDMTKVDATVHEARIVQHYNTMTQTQSTSMTLKCGVGDKVRARVQSTVSVTLSEVNLYIVRQ